MSQILDDLKMRFVLNRDMVFYTTIMYALDIYISEDVPTAATDGLFIKFNPVFLGSLDKDEQEFLLAHEIMHVCYEHALRVGERDWKKWNIANDHVINLELKDFNMKMPKGGYADRKYKGMSSEDVYELLPDPPKDYEGDLIPNPSKEAKETIKDALIQAVMQAKMSNQVGNIPQSILRKVDDWLNPVLPWYTILQKYMNTKCKDDYSWSKKNMFIRDRYLPSLYSEQVGDINFFIDGSCSVSDEMFSLQVNQIKWIKQNINPKNIKIVVFNTQIVDVFTFRADQKINVEFNARGGTDIGEIVDFMAANPAEANIIFTDGYFNHVPMAHIHEVIWCIYSNPSFSYDSGRVITIPEEK